MMIQLIHDDPWLTPYTTDIQNRLNRYKEKLASLGNLKDFANAYTFLGLNYDENRKGWWYREWAPGADQLYILGDFNGWNPTSHPLKNEEGIWRIFLSERENPGFIEGSYFKVKVEKNGISNDKIPAYATYVKQDEKSYEFCSVVRKIKRNPKTPIDLASIKSPVVYECHIGMAQEKNGVGTYTEFKNNVLPYIKELGYNCIQIMGIHEHPYYGSFGYHVSNFFASSSRFGTPDELMDMINEAHKLGIAVIMDIVHSHAVKNTKEGLNQFDGTNYQYFHDGGRGDHHQWDSKCFNYGKPEVLQFLLANVKYWIDEFDFDGFRFDGVTSMLYKHHGDMSFDHYDKYFKNGVDNDAILYLQLANHLLHDLKPNAISIAEDMSGMPGLCYPIEEGGVGFDYRLAMGIPDNWIKLLKHSKDEEWNMHNIWNILNNRRYKEKNIAYAESHDQALVGDKTIAFWLMDKEMYTSMTRMFNTPVVERGMALHKMIRLVTASLGGEGYLSFMGNEFGHPEWIDFPREGNGWSYHYARRQWSLVKNEDLKYQFLANFEGAMIETLLQNNVLNASFAEELYINDGDQVLIFKRGDAIFAFNFSPTNSYSDYEFYAKEFGEYELVLNTDNPKFDGFNRVDPRIHYYTYEKEMNPFMKIYLPSRTALVLKKCK